MEETVLFQFVDGGILDSWFVLVIVSWSSLSHIFYFNSKSLVFKFSFQLLMHSETHSKAREA